MHFLGKNIKYLRRQYSHTQSELAALIQKGQTTIGNWENGISEPNIEELLILSNYFDISLDNLVRVDLSKTNWKNRRIRGKYTPPEKREVSYDDSNLETLVREEGPPDLSYVLQKISNLEDEIGKIQDRLGKDKS